MQFPITIGLRRSFLAWLLPLLGICLAIGLALLLPVHAGIRSVMVMAALIGAALLVRRAPFRHCVNALRLSPDGSISLAFSYAPDYFLPAVVQPGATVHRWLTVVRLKVGRRIYPVVLTPEAIDPDDFRRLRVFLRYLVKFSGRGAAV